MNAQEKFLILELWMLAWGTSVQRYAVCSTMVLAAFGALYPPAIMSSGRQRPRTLRSS